MSSFTSIVTLVLVVVFVYSTNAATNTSSLIALNQFSVFTCGDFTSSNSNTAGRIAAAGNIDLSFYSVGNGLPLNCSRWDVVAGQALKFSQGQIDRGMAAYGTSVTLNGVGTPCGTPVKTNLINFNSLCPALLNDSKTLSHLVPNGRVSFDPNSRTLSLSGSDSEENVFNLSESNWSEMAVLDIDVPLNSWATINGPDTSSLELGNFHVVLSPTTVLQKILYNFATVKRLSFASLGLEGSVLAPSAAITFNAGFIDGSIAGDSLSGNGEVKYRPYIPLTCRCTCPPSISLPPYSIFAMSLVNVSSSSCAGAIASGGNAYFDSYSVGSALIGDTYETKPPGGNSVVVSGDLTWKSGEAANGNVVVGGSASLTSVGIPRGVLKQHTVVPVNFNVSFSRLLSVSQLLSNFSAAGNVTWQFEALTLSGTDLVLNVFNLTQSELSHATSVTVELPEDSDAWAVINVRTDSSGGSLDGLNMVVKGTNSAHVLFNFENAAKVSISSIAVKASVLAPRAAVNFRDGQLEGSIFCYSLQGNGQVQFNPPSPVYPPCPPCEC